MNIQEFENIIKDIPYEDKRKYKLFIYFKNVNLQDKSIIFINYLSKKFSKIIDFYDLSDYLPNDYSLSTGELILLKDNKNNTVLTTFKINKDIIEKYFLKNIVA